MIEFTKGEMDYIKKACEIRFSDRKLIGKNNEEVRKLMSVLEKIRNMENTIEKARKETIERIDKETAKLKNMKSYDYSMEYDKHRTDTFRVMCEVYSFEPVELLKILHENLTKKMVKYYMAEFEEKYGEPLYKDGKEIEVINGGTICDMPFEVERYEEKTNMDEPRGISVGTFMDRDIPVETFMDKEPQVTDEDKVVDKILSTIYSELDQYKCGFTNGLNRETVIKGIKDKLK